MVGDARLAAEALLAALPAGSNAERAVPFRGDAALPRATSISPATSSRPIPRAPSIRARSAWRSRSFCRRSATWSTTPATFSASCPICPCPGPGHFKLTSDFASIGLGFGTALGVAKARPDETTVLVIGDGGFLMTMGELETVVREDLPLVIVLMNDCAYGAELHFLKMRDLPVAKSVFPDVDFAPIAEALRLPGGDRPHARRSAEGGAAAGQAGRTGVPRLQAERRRRRAVHERVPRVRDPGSTDRNRRERPGCLPPAQPPERLT